MDMFLSTVAAIERLRNDKPVRIRYRILLAGRVGACEGELSLNGSPQTFTAQVTLPNGKAGVTHDLGVSVDAMGEATWVWFLKEGLPVPLPDVWLSDNPTRH